MNVVEGISGFFNSGDKVTRDLYYSAKLDHIVEVMQSTVRDDYGSCQFALKTHNTYLTFESDLELYSFLITEEFTFIEKI